MTALPTLRQIQFLIALRDHRSFHKAAAASNVTQSTLSAGIQEMEATLGAPVIDRSNRRIVRFTPLGQEVIDQGSVSIARMTEIAERARRLQNPLTWPLRMGVIPTIAPYLLPKILRPLRKAFPEMTLNLHEVQSSQLVEQVRDGTLDFGFMAFPYDTKDLKKLTLMEEPFFCAAPANIFVGKSHVTLEEIEAQKLLLLSDGHCLRDHVLQACNMTSASKQDVSATSLATLMQLTTHGYGITLLPEMAITEAPLSIGLRILNITPKPPTRNIGIVWRKNAGLEHDIMTVALSVYRLMKGTTISDDTCNIQF
jgi:LysR family transcriptional regulator, hydrogen peroxide-inducible genes activator